MTAGRSGGAGAGAAADGTAADGAADGTAADGAADGRAGLTRRGRRAAGPLLRRHWLISVLLLAGLTLRILAEIAYRPALLYIDSLKYLFGAWPGNDPLGYNVILKVLLLGGNLATVAMIQHLLGLAMALVLYWLLLRRGTPRWLAAVAAAPVLLDAYQLQIEQTIMPDVWFEALIVAGLALLLWQRRPGPWRIVGGGLALGAAAPIAQVGQILIVPALAFVLISASGWRRRLTQGAALCVAFAIPIVAFSAQQYVTTRHFSLAPRAGNTIYGRMAESADCATLKLPGYERALCPPRALALRLGPDGLVHNAQSPDRTYTPPAGMTHAAVIADFDQRVLTQQPLRVAWGVLRDAAKLFAVHRTTSRGDTPISRWRFQTYYPTYGSSIFLSRDHTIMLGLRFYASGGPTVNRPLSASLGGKAVVVQPLAAFLRGYQLDGGYTPGPLLAIEAIAGLLGTLAVARRGRSATPAERQLALACLLVFGAAAAVLLASDAFEFSWRYQLPALVTLPPAGALGITLGIAAIRRHARPGRDAEGGRGTAVPERAAPDGVTALAAAPVPSANGHEAPSGHGLPNGHDAPHGHDAADGIGAADAGRPHQPSPRSPTD
ncbi:MAG TPA: phospholipid carrier-dependent glycosyltransferase [Streptosporangiaceae bacterium]|nr:phospholipid carrier-dependent glycosyltransferase [Streptosporangiaceae bacterium]